MTTQIKSLNSVDYYINYYGTKIIIRNTPQVLALSIGGGGYTESGRYYGSEKYELYIPNKADFGKTLIYIGYGVTTYNGIEIECHFELNGTKHQVLGFDIDGMFMKIFKN